MTTWIDGFKGGYYRQSSNVWHAYANGVGQVSNDDVYFNQSVALAINHGDAITSFVCTTQHSGSGSGGSGPPYSARIQAILNSTSLVTNAATALSAINPLHLTTAYLDITWSSGSPFSLDLTAIAQEVVNEAHWANGNKITFVMQGTAGFGGTLEQVPAWNGDSYTLGGGGGGGTGGQNGVNASAFLMMLEDPQ